MQRRKSLFLFSWMSILWAVVSAEDWPQFRGPDGQGHSDAKGIPIVWSEEKNITWKSAVPGQGYSSPVIAGNQIWLTSSQEGGKSLHAVCLDKVTGNLLHDVEVLRTEDVGSKHRLNGYVSPTLVLDGTQVMVHLRPRGTVCLDTAARTVWKNSEF